MKRFKVKINDQEFFVEVEEIEDKKESSQRIPKQSFSFNKPVQSTEPKAFSEEDKKNKDAIYAQLPGTVVKLLKNEGDMVLEKEAVLILEAMKMENEIIAHKKGIIKRLYVKQGQKVSKGDILLEIE